ncbi:MAG: adenylate/guanylate cyclase domain-containing protein [Chloroflexi bacterium]|nr:adenylate/guanylate cyclase domain-containing protein [Chloroflexota bacterium]
MPPTKRRFSLHLVLLLGTALLLAIAEVASVYPSLITPVERFDLAARDAATRLRGVRPPNENIVIVAIDDFSFNWTGYRWPWPRAYLAEIVDWLNDAGAQVIGLDVFLFEADQDPGGDPALARALDNAPSAATVIQKYTDQQGVISLRLPLPIYREVLDGMGITPVLLDDDAIARSILAYDTYLDQTYYNWAFELARLYTNGGPPSAPTPSSLVLGSTTVPLQNRRFLVNFAGPSETYPTYSAARVVLGDYPPEAFRDKIVLIGATSVTLQDIYPTPFSSRIRTPGVEIVANAVDTMLRGAYLRVTPPGVNILFIIAAALLSSLIVRSPRPGLTITLMTAAMLLYGVLYYAAFVQRAIFLPFTGPEAMLFLGVVLPTLEQAISQEIEKRRVRNLFTRFISPEMVDQLLAIQDINALNKRADLTILFADIRNFTTLSEKLTPEEVVTLLNSYLEAMTAVIHKHGGTVDKYEGDAIVAFFGEPVPHPDHALRAARAAVEMRQALDGLKERWAAEGRLPKHFDIGIGLNSGEVFVGLLGSEQRINYTVIGDNANLAARLQDLTKVYACPIIVSESTCERIRDEFETAFIDAVIVKGRTEAVKVYKVLGCKAGK